MKKKPTAKPVDGDGAVQQPKLVSTGITGLDEVLLGGVTSGNIMLVEGAAGTGKTSLGLEFIYRGAVDLDEPGLIISFELAPDKLLRDAAGFGWDFHALEKAGKTKIIYTSPLVLLHELESHDSVLLTEIAKMGAKRVLIDGLTPLRVFSEVMKDRPFRDTLHVLVESMQRQGVTAMLTREVPASEAVRAGEFSHEHFVCDTIVTLRCDPRGRSVVRSLEIAKSRGQDFITGRHTLRIEAGKGVRIFQRAQARPRALREQPTSVKRSSLGVPAIDEMIGDGVFDGSVTLVVGVSGTGKTLLGVQYLVEGARLGKKGLLVSLDEHPAQIARNAAGLGLSLDEHVKSGAIVVHYESPQELELDVHFHQLTELIEKHKVERILIDSLAAYLVNEEDRREFRDFIYALTTYLKDRLITAFMNFESPELLGVSQISQEIKASTIVDNIILLNYVEVSDRLRRAITVPKARGSAPLRETREYTIQHGGIALVPREAKEVPTTPVPQLPFSSYYGVLARSPARRSPLVDEAVSAGRPPPDIDASGPADGSVAPARAKPRHATRKKSGKRAADARGRRTKG